MTPEQARDVLMSIGRGGLVATTGLPQQYALGMFGITAIAAAFRYPEWGRAVVMALETLTEESGKDGKLERALANFPEYAPIEALS